jgi:hypothetical protein
MIYFNIVRLFIIIWAAFMISAVESVAIRTEGQVELESTSRDAYAKVLTLAVGSFLGDAAFNLRKSNDTNRSKVSRGNSNKEEAIKV